LLVSVFTTASAITEDEKKINDKKSELNQVGKDIENKKEQLEKVKREQTQVAAQIQAIEDQIEEKEKELAKAEQQLAETQEQLEKTREELAVAIETAEKQKEEMADRIRAIYMNGNAGYLQLLFESRSLNEFLDRLEIVKWLVSYDNQVLEDMRAYQEAVDAKRQELEEEERSITLTCQQIEQQKKDIENKKKEREKLLDKLQDQEVEYEKDLDELEKTSKELEKKIQQMLKELEEKKKRSQYTGGVLTWPVPGFYRITSSFGYRIHPIYGTNRMHTGIDIGSNYEGENKISIYGQNFVAGADGTVLHAGWYGSYGNCVIIDHGGGITTLYAHGSKVLVSAGQTVKRGQPVMKVGSTGASTGAHAHFEVRKNGTPVNPMDYLGKK